MNAKIIFQFLFFFLSFYCFGAGMMDSFVIYHGWKFVGAADFATVHRETGDRIVQIFVFATLLMTIMTIIMLWKRPVIIPKSWIVAALTCEMISWVSSAIIQIPIQAKLSQGKDVVALERLLLTDWIRIIGWVVYIIIVSCMVVRILSKHERDIVRGNRQQLA